MTDDRAKQRARRKPEAKPRADEDGRTKDAPPSEYTVGPLPANLRRLHERLKRAHRS